MGGGDSKARVVTRRGTIQRGPGPAGAAGGPMQLDDYTRHYSLEGVHSILYHTLNGKEKVRVLLGQ